MAATRHHRPALDVQSLLGHRARWPYDLTWKGEIGSGHFDTRASGHGPVAVPGRVVGPEGGVNGAGGAVQHHRRQCSSARIASSAARNPRPTSLSSATYSSFPASMTAAT